MTTDHIMCDIETLGTKPRTVVLQCAMIRFDPHVQNTYEELLEDSCTQYFNVQDQLNKGRVIDASTLDWWASGDHTTAPLRRGLQETGDVGAKLDAINRWLGTGRYKLWGNGVSFDNVIMEALYYHYGREWKFKFWDYLDLRTIKAMTDAKKLEPPVGQGFKAHDATCDAALQAYYVQRWVAELGIKLK